MSLEWMSLKNMLKVPRGIQPLASVLLLSLVSSLVTFLPVSTN